MDGVARMTPSVIPHSINAGSALSAALKNDSPGRNRTTNSGDRSKRCQYSFRESRSMVVPASVNGRPVHFLVDTGASETALTEEDARKIGLKVDPTKYELVGEGASGMVRGQYVDLDSIDLDGIRQSGAKAVIVEGASISLLGQPFLEDVDEIVIRKGEMVLKESSKA